MNTTLCITIRFIQPFPLFHGRRDAEQPEWPPSPMRAFQALLSAASMRSRGRPLSPELRSALYALEVCRPQLVAPRATVSTVGHRPYVPHNQYDLVAMALHRGIEQSSEAFRKLVGSVRNTTKDHRPMRIETFGDELPALHYLYPLDATMLDPDELLRAILPSVRAITHLGWGIDQVVADATLLDCSTSQPAGERWLPSAHAGRRLRVHRNGSLDALIKRHRKFLDRLQNGWTPVPPLTDDDVDQVRYRREIDPLPRPYAVFKLLDENYDTFRYPHAKLIHIAGMVRHLAIEAMSRNPPGWVENPADWVSRVVRGKRDESAGGEHKQFSYIPLPSIGAAHADAMIRNVMVVAPLGMVHELNYLAERLDGTILKPEGEWESCESVAKPNGLHHIELRKFTPPSGKFIDLRYLGTSSIWHSVTPVILDGHNDKKAQKTIKLIQFALQRAHIETPCDFTWQAIPFFRNCLSAHKYDHEGRHAGYHRPAHLKNQTAVHLALRFHDGSDKRNPVEIPGPLALGAGRHCGLGLMAGLD